MVDLKQQSLRASHLFGCVAPFSSSTLVLRVSSRQPLRLIATDNFISILEWLVGHLYESYLAYDSDYSFFDYFIVLDGLGSWPLRISICA